jgi:hypothetical protein
LLQYIWVEILGQKVFDLPEAWQSEPLQVRIKNRWRNLNEMRRERMLIRVGLNDKARRYEYSTLGGGKAMEVILNYY